MLSKFLSFPVFVIWLSKTKRCFRCTYWNSGHTVKLPFQFTKLIQCKLYFISISLTHCTANMSVSISHTIITCCCSKLHLFVGITFLPHHVPSHSSFQVHPFYLASPSLPFKLLFKLLFPIHRMGSELTLFLFTSLLPLK